MIKLSVVSVIIMTCFLQNPTFAQKLELSQKQILTEKLKGFTNPLPAVLRWVDDEHYLLMREGKTYLGNAANGSETLATEKDKEIKKVIKSNEPLLRGKELYLTGKGEEKKLKVTPGVIKNPTTSPDGNYIAYTKDNDLYSYDISADKEYRLTSDGSIDTLNGYASWVYYEEILGRSSAYKAFWWSPDSKNIAYFRSDQSRVPTYLITDIVNSKTVEERTKYPKVGENNPTVKVGVVPATGGATVWANLQQNRDEYYGMPYWKPDGKTLLVQWLNRLQDSLIIYEMQLDNGNVKPFYTEIQKTWVDLDDNERFRFSTDAKNIILQSDKSGWKQLYLYDINGNMLNQITPSGYTVMDVNYIDEQKKKIYFTARGKENTATQDFYVVGYDGKKLERLTFGPYNHAVYNISPTGKYFFTRFSNSTTPAQIALVSNTGKLIKSLGDSKTELLDKYDIAQTSFLRVKSKDGLFALPMKITWPQEMDKGKKYPVLISIYGGPNAGTAWDSWTLSPTQQWYAKEGLIQVVMDHRASGHFGKKGVNYMYHNLGYWEMEDYTTMVKWLIDSAQADPAKIAITGFSYGGYLSAYALTYGAGTFTHAMAGGSVTDWRFYDTHYTEKFMGTPVNNPEGYKTSSVLNHVKNYKGVLQLVHGNMDDNVHLENSIALASALQDEKKYFEYMTYSGGRHGWGGTKRNHFENLKTSFIYKYLLEKPVPTEILQ